MPEQERAQRIQSRNRFDKCPGNSDGLALHWKILIALVAGSLAGYFSAVFGLFMSQIEHVYADTLYRITKAVFETMLLLTHWVMRFAPYGVSGLVAAVMAKTGFSAAGPASSW